MENLLGTNEVFNVMLERYMKTSGLSVPVVKKHFRLLHACIGARSHANYNCSMFHMAWTTFEFNKN